MKFLRFVSCCGSSAGRKESPEESTAALVTAAAQQIIRREKRRKRCRAASAARGEWRPTLGSISEDNVAAVVAVEKQRKVKRKEGSGGGRRCERRNVASISDYREDDYRQTRYTAVFPAFSASPFMI